jgi:hypothetical protein
MLPGAPLGVGLAFRAHHRAELDETLAKWGSLI